MNANAARITAIGSYVPSRVLSNADLERMVNTSDDWIVQRTGIRERRIAAKDEFTSHLIFRAVEDMLQRYPVGVRDADMILVATYTPDFPTPSVACMVQSHFNIAGAGALDVNAACAGFAYALGMADSLIRGGTHRKILVVGADTASKIVDYTDRSSCILFGDGAGAVLVERTDEAGSLLAQQFGSDGSGGVHLYRSGLRIMPQSGAPDASGLLRQNGREVYRFAVGTVPAGIRALLDQVRWSAEDIDWFVPHSANLRIIESLCEKTGIPLDKTLLSIECFGNTTAASIPLSLDLGVKSGRVKPGDRLLLYGFGSGFTFGGIAMRWTLQPQRPSSAERQLIAIGEKME